MTVSIHGREYVTVSERVSKAHASGKTFEIITSQPLQVGERWVWRVEIRLGDLRYAGSAIINFDAKPGSAEHKDCLATAETSAVGRALGFAGILSDDSIASADEIERGPVERTQPVAHKQPPTQLKRVPDPQPHPSHLDALKLRAVKVGWIQGADRDELRTAWDARMAELFGGPLLVEDYCKVSTLGQIEATIELFAQTRPKAS